MGLYKILKYVAYLVGALGVILFFWLFVKGDAALTESAELQDSILNPFITLTWIVLFLTVLAVLVFVVLRFFEANVKTLLISIGAFVIVFLIAFVVADSSPIQYPNGTGVSGSGNKWIQTGLTMFYILGVVAVVALLVSSVKKLTFRN